MESMTESKASVCHSVCPANTIKRVQNGKHQQVSSSVQATTRSSVVRIRNEIQSRMLANDSPERQGSAHRPHEQG